MQNGEKHLAHALMLTHTPKTQKTDNYLDFRSEFLLLFRKLLKTLHASLFQKIISKICMARFDICIR